MSAIRRQHEPAFKAKVALAGAARRRDCSGTGGAFRGPSQPDLRLEEGAGGGGAQGVRRPYRQGRSA
jgi:hypothetical protein